MADATNQQRQGPLANIRVIELGSILAGPFCGQIFADLGAEVIKVEAPGMGDPMRMWGREKTEGKPLWWSVVARNKKCITLNLRESRGQAILKQLIGTSDFLLENFRPGTLEKWNLGYDNLSKEHPGLIMIRVSGQGQTGPYSKRAGYGSIGEAMGGLRYIVGDPATPPSRLGISIGDTLTGTVATIGALAALNHREQTGRGQVIDAAIYESVLAVMESLVPDYQQTGFIRERSGAILPFVAPSNVYPTKDNNMILIGANQDTVFQRLAEVMQQPELADDEKYKTHTARGQRQQELDELISRWTKTLNADELVEKLGDNGVPAGKIYRAKEMLEDPHFQAREAITEVDHPEYGNVAMQNIVPKMSLTPGKIRHPGRALGADNESVYGDILGFSDLELEALKTDGII